MKIFYSTALGFDFLSIHIGLHFIPSFRGLALLYWQNICSYQHHKTLILISIITSLLYIVAVGAISTRLFHKEGPLVKVASYCIFIALVTHLASVYAAIATVDGQNLSILNVASLIAWLITCVVSITSVKQKQWFLLPLVAGFSAIVILANIFVPRSAIMHIELNPSLLVHISLALFAYGSLCIASLYALQSAFINNRLKHKSSMLLHSSLPPLMEVEQNLFKLLLFGTILLTLSLFSGFVFLEDMFAQRQVHKTILSLIAWFIFAGTLIAHSKFGSRGKSVVIATFTGTALLTLAYFGSRIVKEVLLS